MDEWPSAAVIHAIRLDEKTFVRRKPEVQRERAAAVYDLLQENRFLVKKQGACGPYHLCLSLGEGNLHIDVADASERRLAECVVAMDDFWSIIKDYLLMCESYYGAIRTAAPSKIEAIDMGRRGLHNEAAEMLRERLEAQGVDVDFHTARGLFTLICVLHIRG